VGGYAPRALKDSVRPRRLADVVARPLNFTVRAHPRLYHRAYTCNFHDRRPAHMALYRSRKAI
jgi:hypothetical protein